MKFNLTLDESLFDDVSIIDSPETEVSDLFDDDFSEYEDDHSLDAVPPGPAEGADTGAASELIALINDEWEAIQGYNNAIATLRYIVEENPFYSDVIKVLEEISAEENVHVGQLQEILKQISPNAAKIEAGTKEAASQLGFVDGVLPVQTWDNSSADEPSTDVNNIDETCTLSDVDDNM